MANRGGSTAIFTTETRRARRKATQNGNFEQRPDWRCQRGTQIRDTASFLYFSLPPCLRGELTLAYCLSPIAYCLITSCPQKSKSRSRSLRAWLTALPQQG